MIVPPARASADVQGRRAVSYVVVAVRATRRGRSTSTVLARAVAHLARGVELVAGVVEQLQRLLVLRRGGPAPPPRDEAIVLREQLAHPGRASAPAVSRAHDGVEAVGRVERRRAGAAWRAWTSRPRRGSVGRRGPDVRRRGERVGDPAASRPIVEQRGVAGLRWRSPRRRVCRRPAPRARRVPASRGPRPGRPGPSGPPRPRRGRAVASASSTPVSSGRAAGSAGGWPGR